MELIDRPRPSRDLELAAVRDPRRASREQVKLAIGHAPRGFRPAAPNIGARIGCDPLQAARDAAASCGVPSLQQSMAQQANSIYGQAPAGISPDNCSSVGLRYVSLGAGFTVAAAAAATSATISPGAPFLPYAIVFAPVANAGKVLISSIKYGTVEELIGGSLNGELFIPTAFQQGYRIAAKSWVVPGQTIVLSGTAISALAATTDLTAMVYGFTNAPG